MSHQTHKVIDLDDRLLMNFYEMGKIYFAILEFFDKRCLEWLHTLLCEGPTTRGIDINMVPGGNIRSAKEGSQQSSDTAPCLSGWRGTICFVGRSDCLVMHDGE